MPRRVWLLGLLGALGACEETGRSGGSLPRAVPLPPPRYEPEPAPAQPAPR